MSNNFQRLSVALLTIFSTQVISSEIDSGNHAKNIICSGKSHAISHIQGNSESSPFVGKTVQVEAVVTADFQETLEGFYLQSSSAKQDADPETSEGIFVYTADTPVTIALGNLIRFSATVEEHEGLTRLAAPSKITVCEHSVPLPAPVKLRLPFTEEPEHLEGMRVSINDMTVNDVYHLGRFGTITLANGRRFIPTQVATPGDAARAQAARNNLNKILLDDGSDKQNPEFIPYPATGLSAQTPLRVGDKLSLESGVMHYASNNYRIHPVSQAKVVKANPRPEMPELTSQGNLKVASFNVLNYFTTMDKRGADNEKEFARQQAKTIAALAALDADIIGLMEVENNGFTQQGALANLVAALNKTNSAKDWQFVKPTVKQIGTDSIMVAIIYRESVVNPVNAAAILDSTNSSKDANGRPLYLDTKNRPTLAQKFLHIESGEHFVVSVSHLKSKGSNCNDLGDPNMQDGQGNCNLTRTRAAKAIAHWLNTEFKEEAIISIGDLNAYAKEDPLMALSEGGFIELFHHLQKEKAYSYVFAGQSGQLDHALANEAMLNKVLDVTEWHINTDEPIILDYNMEHKTEAQLEHYYSADPYRSSDHDPVVIALQMGGKE
ncbi:ExeM/NucH family extracellular endonuclease [Planctobacterium marinum]|uniref:Endonuclease/exonuclease/phosphatase domain-containing protein n=1 Tax=Planctobacterium marinum TaxID=1631968 RepID=A0AA48HWT8_9ALTE|nr:hypothetical protein MACH26_15610 [Planctobacterium marinum]